MAALALQTPLVAGTGLTFAAASGGGDTLPTGGLLYVKNGGGSGITVTITSVATCNQGQTHNVTVTVAAGADELIGPFGSRFSNASDGLVHVGYSSVTSVTVAALTAVSQTS